MHVLQRELESNEELSAVVRGLRERTAESKIKLGLVLDLNPLWLQAFRLKDIGLNPDRHIMRLGYRGGLDWTSRLAPLDSHRVPDLTSRFKSIDRLNNGFFNRVASSHFQPYILKIAVRPNSFGYPGKDIEDDEYQYERDRLIDIAREAQVLTVVETHSKPNLLSAPGSRITSRSGNRGTLGGYVEDQYSFKTYGMTCGHVVSGPVLSSSGNRLGVVTHRKAPTPLPPNINCNQTCNLVTELDVSLFYVNNPPKNNATSIASRFGNGQLIKMDGATTPGVVTYEIGGHVIEYEIGGACWKNLVQFHAPLAGVVPVGVKLAMTPVPKPGDSGAWLIRGLDEWVGMVVAANSMFGFALSSTNLINAADREFGTKLDLA